MNRFSYTLLLRLLSPALLSWMWLRARKQSGEWQILSRERFGRYGRDETLSELTGAVWVHAVSLGETRAAQPLVKALLASGFKVLLTHTTPTAKTEGARLFSDAISSGELRQVWLPYDFPGSVQRFMAFFKPRCGILIEREVWPNLVRAASRSGVSMVLASARFSEASLRQSRWLGRVLRHAYASLDLVLAQTQPDADRLKEAGAHGPHVVGNLKFDVGLSPEQLEEGRRWRRNLGRPTMVIASTRDGEEELFLAAMAALPRKPAQGTDAGANPLAQMALHLLVPRHPQRFGEVATLLQSHFKSFVRRSSRAMPSPQDAVLLGDTLGEMGFYFAAADVAIVGGGFAPFGGQNFIEACAAGTPVIVGPHMYNFSQATRDAVAAGAAIQVSTPEAALREAYALLGDIARRTAMREAAKQWLSTHVGATARIMQALRPWLGNAALPHDSGQ
ncbi:3-deoxy-D-manno-octulosonic acid transferase [Bordetella genomosp. 9]|uniref:3-deoxy-D-manno-octulosonic acid transferase n=1 Tax=Bordetella genomosp. 9 TaxID=1416803 RepID=UPI000A2949AF|nr:3-deoxy-D-manno-octulosonic acid transferase [Bordetella genomosp. 9]ARP92224.1 3-deoxy-D-manno-octulosonic acid transferase [Bordetella genomosp. 9]